MRVLSAIGRRVDFLLISREEPLWRSLGDVACNGMRLAQIGTSPIVLVLVVVLVLDLGAFPASKEVENEDDWGSTLYRAKHVLKLVRSSG